MRPPSARWPPPTWASYSATPRRVRARGGSICPRCAATSSAEAACVGPHLDGARQLLKDSDNWGNFRGEGALHPTRPRGRVATQGPLLPPWPPEHTKQPKETVMITGRTADGFVP